MLLVAVLETFFNPFHRVKMDWKTAISEVFVRHNLALDPLNTLGGGLEPAGEEGKSAPANASLLTLADARKTRVENILPNDPLLNREYAVLNDGSFTKGKATPFADIQLAEAWQVEKGDSNVTVAVLDGGIQMNNPDFKGRIWTNKKEIPGNGIDDDHNGYVDDVNGWNFSDRDNDLTDRLGHGTNVASIIGADANNGIGYAGVDWNCKIMPLKVVDDQGHGDYGDWADAVYYAVNNGARVINMSLGGAAPSRKLKNAIEYAYQHNVVVVAAMMNTNSDTKYYPAAYPHVIAVGATGPDDNRATPFSWSASSGSNYGSNICVVAPGAFIYGPSPDGKDYDVCWSGTSQATPYVSGLASLLIAQDPSRTPDQIKKIIEATADDQVGNPAEDTKGWDEFYGYGRINAYKALTYKN
jgi:subtilisin family serine protease